MRGRDHFLPHLSRWKARAAGFPYKHRRPDGGSPARPDGAGGTGPVRATEIEAGDPPCPTPKPSPFKYFKPEIIRLAVMLYVRLPLSLRNA